MKNIYIFITSNIKTAGGTQCYTAAKASYLESQGWEVRVLSASYPLSQIKCPISYLRKFADGNFVALSISPYKLPKCLVFFTLNRIIRFIGHVRQEDEVIVESHEDCFSQWGELLASRLKARHYFYLMNEFYRQPFQTYVEKMGFYKFKFDRHEILGSHNAFQRLFEGYYEISSNDYPKEAIISECPVQDVDSIRINNLPHKDWTIGYIGRGNKTYVPNILNGIDHFAKGHKDKQICFLAIGDLDCHRKMIHRMRIENENLVIVELGLMHPIPRSFFQRIDVVIAGAGSARHSAEEGALVLIADTEHCMCNGLLGIETNNDTYRDEGSVVSDFETALNRVLVEKVYLKLPNRRKGIVNNSVEYSVKQNFDLFNNSDKRHIYYDEKELLRGKIDVRRIFKTYLYYCHPGVYSSLISLRNRITRG